MFCHQYNDFLLILFLKFEAENSVHKGDSMKLKILMLPVILVLPNLVLANELYVSTSGSDSNSGALSAPFRTIQKAANAATAGSTIHVAAGNYAETIVSRVSGSAAARIRFISDTKWGAKILPNGVGGYTMWSAQGGFTDIEGFEVNGTGGTNVRVGIYLNGGNSSVKNSLVHHVAETSGCDNRGGAGLLSDQGRGPTFTNYDFIGNTVHHVGAGCGWIQGIYHSSSGNIKNNVVYAASQGLNLGHDAHNINAVNNTLFGNSGYGVHYGGCQEAYNNGCPTYGIKVHNNIIFDNYGGVAGPITVEDVDNEVKNNLIYGNTKNFDLASPSNSSRTGEIAANPQFVNYIRTGGGDYHLKSTSPAIDKGLTSTAPSTDIDGNARSGAGVDLGAYEFGSSAPIAKPIISLSANSLTFANQLIGSTSSIQYVTLSNTGTASLSFPIAFGMTGDFTFGGTGTCSSSASYAPGTSCTASVVFKPTATGTRSGVLTIPSNATTTPISISLSGTGMAAPIVDQTAPLTAITYPYNSTYMAIGTYVTIQATASDNVAVKSVQFYVNNSLKCTVSVAPYKCVWRVPYTRGLKYSIQTKVYDAAGNVGVSSIKVITSK
jgi:hypothetical protein